ncbi:MAG TPA: hypothetical protein VMS98_08410 [Thermoanaerobaculia bacterium]|nr:hypothetical protein [Thermoanaerobaculia bacterium]
MTGGPRFAPVFIAASVAEIDTVEKLLDDEGIQYDVRPHEFLRGTLFAACSMGVLFEVHEGQAEYCRRLFAESGLAAGVVGPDDIADERSHNGSS